MRALIFALLAVLVVAVAAEQYNPIRAIRARRLNAVAELEKYFDNNPLGQKIAQYIEKSKELIGESLLLLLCFKLI
ncbi:unnamed protein product [Dibothriocephalus latus]|uniref:Uncharacterized protein n=1 Tax=Dibothriocephalus latus TaxID=60516 RepID=A0A3P7MLC8_DIBLA|nr:unnamed protein product [Dibothriocephalus latus]